MQSSMSLTKKQVYIFVGRPGSGKGTQRKMLTEYVAKQGHSYVDGDMGSLIRAFAEKKEGSVSAEKIKEVLLSGGLVPSVLPITLFSQHMFDSYNDQDFIIVDGFGRKPIEMLAFRELFLFLGMEHIHLFLLDIPEEESFKRLEARGRADDTPDSIKERLARFADTKEGAMGAIQTIEKTDEVTLYTIDGMGSEEEIHKRVLTHLAQ